MKKSIVLLFFFLVFYSKAQEKAKIEKVNVSRIENILASDDMEGRAIFTPGIAKASAFIENEFKNIGLSFYKDLQSYRQEFDVKGKSANNVVAVLVGQTKPDEYVIFSAHYDHLGLKEGGKDRIYNGANDDASGTTAVIALANYFKEKNQNQRTIIFVAFTGEEIGGLGSNFFSKSIDAKKVVAMFNIEMIGTESKWGKKSAYITGFEKSDFGLILQRNLLNSNFKFYPDPYPKEQLFYRSDNARLAALGVPAHTISTSKMDIEPNYHKVSDEVGTLDLDNMTEIIEAIALSSQSIINGEDSPSRVTR
ncbi:M20/M25/M40 family metallo-hydrolase [Flavobacterium sp. NG2]|uniref:M20/M25/M40 family metallo-hydrolase n=1 Tax=Flavobacterium sp. NG2 TaxID=3097547 RepID=UPI002A800153|nr:M20/M25/M40 family metallo-hydrolase [Flavobacterium sp. NG2]WPR72609.1 M20/M25/M40 family metallo-hydrolase [Flavobacterium sp. NG2]